ncbi:2'-5' RNA ligase family protein [Streptomyces flavidovirens]|uniref:2'-5' RNA ligase family protein n=1 Tax=Streptomyces flavidovirens TaxID=67298 RepID=A0ABW6RGB5_9ACTN
MGWPDVAGDTALTIKVPEADPLVRAGFPAHVTVLYPFLHESRTAGPVHRELLELFRSYDPFDLTFCEFGRYPGVLFLAPQPADPIRALTKELTGRWPEAVPYRGLFGEGLDPHLTIANHEGPDTWERAYDALEAQCAPALPVTSRVETVHLIVRDGEQWRDHTAYRLGDRV